MKKFGVSLILALLVLCIMLPAGALAKTYYLHEVSASGANPTKFKVTESSDSLSEAVTVNGKTWNNYSLDEILSDSYGKLDADETVLSNRLLQKGDTVVLPAGNYNLKSTNHNVYGDITVMGAGKGLTVLTAGTRGFHAYNRYAQNFIGDGVVYNVTLEGLTLQNGSQYPVYITGYNIDLTLRDVEMKNFGGHAIGIWGSQTPLPSAEDNTRISVHLENVNTDNNGATMKLETPAEKDANGNVLTRISIDFDEECKFNDNDTNESTKIKRLEISNRAFNAILAGQMDEGMNNVRVNDMYVLPDGTLIPVNPPAPPADPEPVDPVAPAAPVDLPQTGDSSMLALWTAVCALAVAAFAAMKKRCVN